MFCLSGMRHYVFINSIASLVLKLNNASEKRKPKRSSKADYSNYEIKVLV